MRRTLLVSWVFALAGCHDGQMTNPRSAEVRLFPAEAFAGAEVFLTGDRYRDDASSYVVRADTTFLAVHRVDDSTIAARLPSDVNGPLIIWERMNNRDLDRGTVTAHGFMRMAVLPRGLDAYLTPSFGPEPPYVVAGDSTGLTIIHPATDLVTRFPGFTSLSTSQVIGRGAGITYLPNRFLLPPLASDPAVHAAYYLQPDTLRDGTVPIPGGRLMSEISRRLYLITGSNSITTYGYDTTTSSLFPGSFGYWLNAFRHYVSPSGNRATVSGSSLTGTSDSGAVVLDANTGLPAYRVRSVMDVADAAFSADGGVLYLASDESVVAVNALTGDSLASLTSITHGGYVRALAFDPVASLLYVMSSDTATTANDTRVEIRVVDPATLTVKAIVASPSNTQCGYCALTRNSVLQVDRATAQVTALLAFYDHVTILHFSLPPLQ